MSEDYDRDNIYSPSFQPYVMKFERQVDGNFHVWVAGEVGHRKVTKKVFEQIRDHPILSRKLKDEIIAALAA